MKICDGNKACSDIAYFFSEICSIYPITPSSPMASNIDALRENKRNLMGEKVRLVEMQSEAGAAGAMHGALISGSLASTFTASQGLLLMIPNMYKMAGEMLPGVIHVAARSIATNALSIFGDHSDVYATRATGFAILASSSVADAQNLAAVAHLAAIKGSIPFLHFMDGFRTSHEINTIEELDVLKLSDIIPFEAIDDFKRRAINLECGFQKGLAMNEDIYFQTQEARNSSYQELPEIVNHYMREINKIMGTDYKPFTYYGASDATNVIVAMGSVTDTIKLVVDERCKQGEKVGCITVHLYRPFSEKYLMDVLPKSVKNIAVLDRTKEAGAMGEPLYLDVVSALKDKDINIVGGRYGLSSKNTTPEDINGVFLMLDGELKNNFTISIVDDVTKTSLEPVSIEVQNLGKEIMVYGFGSDGCVSASKDILKIMGSKGYYVNGYFSYDSKKSGGVTVSNLRVGDKEIRAPFYVRNPEIVVITKDDYLKKFRCFDNIKQEGLCIINTSKSEEELNSFMMGHDKQVLVKKNVNVLVIDADKIARDVGLKGKISKIIEMIMLDKLGVSDALNILSDRIREAFKFKGEKVINSNIEAISKALDGLKLVKIESSLSDEEEKQDVIKTINSRRGDTLTVSEVLEFRDGTFPNGLSCLEKRHANRVAPNWIPENCIECGKCSFVCPHAVIRSFITKEDGGIPYLINKEYNYWILVSEKDCTECGLCIRECPGKNGNKALVFEEVREEKNLEVEHYFNEYQNPEIFNKFNVAGASLCKPKLEFSGACAGCGETPYINLVTRLYGEELVIANATGCSSIYGGSAPSTPYTIPWVNSLFEDNAEFALGMHLSYEAKRDLIKKIMLDEMDNVSEEMKNAFQKYIDNMNDFGVTKEVKRELEKEDIPEKLKSLLKYVPKRTVLAIGGDGWAYDIGFGGLDHVLASGENVKVLVLDTEVYSNTGGQASKASHLGQVCEFSDMGKRTVKKDLFRIAMGIPGVYVASISLGANMMQAIKAIKEAMEHEGPAIIIAYSTCIEQGIKTGMDSSMEEEKLASEVGYTLLMRYNPSDDKLYMDNKEPDFSRYEEFLDNEVRYNALKIKDEALALELLNEQVEYAKKRYDYYKNLSE